MPYSYLSPHPYNQTLEDYITVNDPSLRPNIEKEVSGSDVSLLNKVLNMGKLM